MAQLIQVAGFTQIKVDMGTGGLQDLGFSQDMVQITDQTYFHDVPGDLHGGPQGPPIDTQYLGAIINVRIEMSKWDYVVAQQIKARLRNATTGTIATADIGKLLLQDIEYVRLLLVPTNVAQTINFPIAVPKQAIEFNMGTKFTTFICGFEVHRNQESGLFFDADTTP